MNHTLALKKDGTLWGWGRNGSGQLGDGTKNQYSMAIKKMALYGHKEIIARDNLEMGLLLANKYPYK